MAMDAFGLIRQHMLQVYSTSFFFLACIVCRAPALLASRYSTAYTLIALGYT